MPTATIMASHRTVYHVIRGQLTTHELLDRLKDPRAPYVRSDGTELRGVRLVDRVEATDGRQTVFPVDIAQETLDRYEWTVEPQYRDWIVPAAFVLRSLRSLTG